MCCYSRSVGDPHILSPQGPSIRSCYSRAVRIEMSVSGLNCAHANRNDWWDAIEPGISIEDALTDNSGQPLLVNGFLCVGEDGNVTMASRMAVSLSPIPGGNQLVVEGLGLGGYQFSEIKGLRWTDDSVQVPGVLNGNTLTVSNILSG